MQQGDVKVGGIQQHLEGDPHRQGRILGQSGWAKGGNTG